MAARDARAKTRPPRVNGTRHLDALFRPKSVAVVGASRKEHSIGREVLRNLLAFGFEGPVFPVNPNATFVGSVPCFASLADVQSDVDLAVIVVPARIVPDVARACGKKGVKALVVVSAGFREAGPEGAALEAALLAVARKYDMRIVGPNCMGVVNTDPAVSLNATFAAAKPVRGAAAFVSQSGALGEAILGDARTLGIGISHFASIGNRVDVSPNDLLEYWGNDPTTKLVLMYLESFGNPQNFVRIARQVAKRKPIIAVKGGMSERGSRAATSHTGALAGRDAAAAAALEQCGILRVPTMKDLFTLAAAFARQPLPRGNRVLIVGNAGGPNILTTDACAAADLGFAELTPETKERLRRAVGPDVKPENPVDLIASADASRYEAALSVLFRDPTFDAAIVLFVSPIHIDALAVSQAIVRCVPLAKGRPVVVVSIGKVRDEEAIVHLRENGLPVYRFPEDAAVALAAMARYARFRARPAGKTREFAVDRARARRVVERATRAGRERLSPEECEELFRAYGVPIVRGYVVKRAEEAIARAHELGYPVVLKAVSDAIVHKTEVGGVRLDLRNADDVARAFGELRALEAKAPDLRILVQPHVKGGRETIFGIVRDPQFGPLVLFGLGGIFAEALGDVRVRVAPLTDLDAKELVRGIHGISVLTGARGGEPADLEYLEEVALRLSQLALEVPEVVEADLNPFLAGGSRGSMLALDARVRIAPRQRP